MLIFNVKVFMRTVPQNTPYCTSDHGITGTTTMEPAEQTHPHLFAFITLDGVYHCVPWTNILQIDVCPQNIDS